MTVTEGGCGFVFLTLILCLIPAWITHVIYTISHELWVLLVVGALVPPVGIVHGFMVWFGLGV